MKLRRNWAVEELVVHFGNARGKVLAFARSRARSERRTEGGDEGERPKKKRKVEIVNGNVNGRTTRSQTRRTTAAAGTAVSQTSQDRFVTSQNSTAASEDEDSVYYGSPEQTRKMNTIALEPGTVSCPCCSKPVREANINSHLDRCMAGESTTPPPTISTSTSRPRGSVNTSSVDTTTSIPPGSIAYHHPSSASSTTVNPRLPTINYTLYSDTALRKKLRDLGIPSTGSRETMRRRHTEWMNLWNANCDAASSSAPFVGQIKSKRELLRELDTWERTLGRQIERAGGSSSSSGNNQTGATGVMIKEFDRDRWAKENKSDFEDLIRRAREKRQKSAQEAGNDENRNENGDYDSNAAKKEKDGERVNGAGDGYGNSNSNSDRDRTFSHRSSDETTVQSTIQSLRNDKENKKEIEGDHTGVQSSPFFQSQPQPEMSTLKSDSGPMLRDKDVTTRTIDLTEEMEMDGADEKKGEAPGNRGHEYNLGHTGNDLKSEELGKTSSTSIKVKSRMFD